MREISVACAFKNEEECLPWLMNAIDSMEELVKEVVFVDDESTDNSIQLINEWKKETPYPVIVITNPLEAYNKQKNIALDRCTGKWVLFVDADMTWTTNFAQLYKDGYFNSKLIWDFPLYYTIIDKYHYSVDKNTGGATTRFFRGDRGFRYQWEVHEHIMFPEDVVGLDYSKEEDRKEGFELTHKPDVIGFCNAVKFFENSMLLSDEALLARGERRMRWQQKSGERGIPFAKDTYLIAKHRADDPYIRQIGTDEFGEGMKKLIP